MRTGLLLLYKNNRINNNEALSEFNALVDKLVVIIVSDNSNPFSSRLAQTKQNENVSHACSESQNDFRTQLQIRNIETAYIAVDEVGKLTNLIETFDANIIACAFHPSTYFQSLWQRIKSIHSYRQFIELAGNTLLTQQQLPFELSELPCSFSKFRKAVEPITELLFANAIEIPSQIIPGCITQSVNNQQFTETSALAHLKFYFSSSYPQHYKETRNELDGVFFSTCFSPYLAHGLLGVKSIVIELAHYEHLYGRNHSTEWIYFELLWREYFYWYAAAHGNKLFKKSGLKQVSPHTSFYAQSFKAWCEGYTPSPLVNAIMRELNARGWISNRARQIAASYLVNELQIDWRHGAAYFEQTLIDYDVAINWGNWQYIAGVGADPRGGRHFNIQKQTELYDANGEYRAKWLKHVDEAYPLSLELWS